MSIRRVASFIAILMIAATVSAQTLPQGVRLAGFDLNIGRVGKVGDLSIVKGGDFKSAKVYQ